MSQIKENIVWMFSTYRWKSLSSLLEERGQLSLVLHRLEFGCQEAEKRGGSPPEPCFSPKHGS